MFPNTTSPIRSDHFTILLPLGDLGPNANCIDLLLMRRTHSKHSVQHPHRRKHDSTALDTSHAATDIHAIVDGLGKAIRGRPDLSAMAP
jgi:hypothetical protein